MSENMRVLIVDDHVFILDLLCELLVDEGYLPTAAQSGEEALECFRKSPFPLVISDIHMGGMSGLELLAAIKEMAPETQVVIMSSDASTENLTRAIDLGAGEFMNKPFDDIAKVAMVIGRVAEKARENPRAIP